MNTPTTTPKPAGFSVPETALQTLIKGQATALDLCGLLTMARFSRDDVSTAGQAALVRYIGVGYPAAELTQARLVQYGVVKPVKRRASARAHPRWRIVADHRKAEMPRVWFSNQLVDGYGKFTQPLRRMKGLGDVAARLLVRMYERVDWQTYTAVPPYLNAYAEWKADPEPVATIAGMDLYKVIERGQQCFYDVALPALGLVERPKDEKAAAESFKPMWNALHLLEDTGFIYPVAMVLDAAPDRLGCTPLYCLAVTNRYRHVPAGEEGLAGDLARLAGKLGYPVTDAGGRFTGTYIAAVPRGQPCHVAGLYRLRFRRNDYDRSLAEGWSRLRACNDAWRERVRAAEKGDTE